MRAYRPYIFQHAPLHKHAPPSPDNTSPHNSKSSYSKAEFKTAANFEIHFSISQWIKWWILQTCFFKSNSLLVSQVRLNSSHCQLVQSLLPVSSHQSSLEEKAMLQCFGKRCCDLRWPPVPLTAYCGAGVLRLLRRELLSPPAGSQLPKSAHGERRTRRTMWTFTTRRVKQKALCSTAPGPLRAGAAETWCRHLWTFFFIALWSSTFHLHTHSDLLHLHRLHLQVLNQVMVFNIICASLTQVLQNSPAEIFHSFIIDPDHTPLLVTTDLFAKWFFCKSL